MLKKDKKHNLVGRTGIILSSGVAKDCFLVRKICAVLRGGRARHGAKPRNPKSPKYGVKLQKVLKYISSNDIRKVTP